MPALSIDTDASLDAASSWAGWADELAAARSRLVVDLDELALTGAAAPGDLAAAVDELWALALFVQLVVDRVLAADQMGLDAELDAAGVRDLFEYARANLAATTWSCSAFEYPLPHSAGDPGETYLGEPREPYVLGGIGSAARGRELLLRALRDTATADQIHEDEFQVVRMSDGRYLVVLPGVTDLSLPHLGLNDEHRTVRDLDQHAYPSSRSSDVDDNAYAQMVAQALVTRGVPFGSELVLIGHSYGADTALDLAADGRFNGADGFRVTHVVAAAYYSQPQLDEVPEGTEVLVLQNRYDLPVIAEGVGHAHVVEAVEARVSFFEHVVGGDPIAAIGDVGSTIYHDVGIAVSAVDHTIDHADDIAQSQLGILAGRPDWVFGGARDFVTLEAGVSSPRDGQVVAVFGGGLAGAGHDQDNYIDYLDRTDDPSVTAFLASLGAGTSTTGSAWSIDVSVPRGGGASSW